MRPAHLAQPKIERELLSARPGQAKDLYAAVGPGKAHQLLEAMVFGRVVDGDQLNVAIRLPQYRAYRRRDSVGVVAHRHNDANERSGFQLSERRPVPQF